MGQSIATDTLDAEMMLESNPPSEILINTDYTKVLLEVKKVIDEDAKPIDAMLDTVTRMSNIPSSYFIFLEKEAGKLNEFAQHHRGDINPSCFNDFYSEMMSYYKSKTGRTYFNRDELKEFVFAVRVPSLAEEQSKAEVRSLQ